MTSSLSDNAGVPAPEDLISIYCRCRGIPFSLPQLNFYLALHVFKMAGIAPGVYVGHVPGNASAPNAAQFGQSVEPLGQVGLQIAERYFGSHDTKTTPYHHIIVCVCVLSRSVPADARLFLQMAKGQDHAPLGHRVHEIATASFSAGKWSNSHTYQENIPGHPYRL
uniref:acyl-CoA dehydrogenase family member 11 isoform X3 n=1 Tax=Oncorhynchus gorbuscha TaxID=8017 RepID=UPI001EAF55AC|nr:acyl-CoA dehydrogenase family member 11 isoform X3 [Oncorhynchus gorbuscha]